MYIEYERTTEALNVYFRPPSNSFLFLEFELIQSSLLSQISDHLNYISFFFCSLCGFSVCGSGNNDLLWDTISCSKDETIIFWAMFKCLNLVIVYFFFFKITEHVYNNVWINSKPSLDLKKKSVSHCLKFIDPLFW